MVLLVKSIVSFERMVPSIKWTKWPNGGNNKIEIHIKCKIFTACWPSMLLAFLTRFLQASRSNRFDSKIPRSLLIVFISPSKKRRSGCMKHECDDPIKSRSHWPSFCSAWPTFVKALPYGPSLPNSAPALKKTQSQIKSELTKSNPYLDHVQSHIFQITETSWFFLFNLLEDEIFGPVPRIWNQNRFCVIENFFGPFLSRIRSFSKHFKMWVQFSFFRCSEFFFGQLKLHYPKLSTTFFTVERKQKNILDYWVWRS